jgi:hypothetical protein
MMLPNPDITNFRRHTLSWGGGVASVLYQVLSGCSCGIELSFFYSTKENVMKNTLPTLGAILSVAAIVYLAPVALAADDYAPSMGEHSMAGTIEAINNQTGWMKINTGMGELNIHYPAPTVKDLKKGDKITVHLSYTKDGETMNDSGMMKSDKKAW